jgi:hypothetical protein
MKRAVAAATVAALIAGCASFNGPKGRFTSRDLDTQRPGRLLFQYPIDSTKKPRVDASHIAFDEHQDDESVAERGALVLRPPSRARLFHAGIDLEVRDRWMTHKNGDAPYSKLLTVVISGEQITRFPPQGIGGDSTSVDSLLIRATGTQIRVSRKATIVIAHDTVRVRVLRDPLR